jgi:hypothetical protein
MQELAGYVLHQLERLPCGAASTAETTTTASADIL